MRMEYWYRFTEADRHLDPETDYSSLSLIPSIWLMSPGLNSLLLGVSGSRGGWGIWLLRARSIRISLFLVLCFASLNLHLLSCLGTQSPLLKDSSLFLIRSLTSIRDYCTKALPITSNYTVFNSCLIRLSLRFTFWMKPSMNLISDSSAWKIFYFARSVSITMFSSLRSMTIPWSDTWSGNEALGWSNVSDMYCFLTLL